MMKTSNILDIEVELSNFEGRDRVSLREFLGYANMVVAEGNYREGVADAMRNFTNDK